MATTNEFGDYTFFESCSEPTAFWCTICAETEVLAPGPCEPCRTRLHAAHDAENAAKLETPFRPVRVFARGRYYTTNRHGATSWTRAR